MRIFSGYVRRGAPHRKAPALVTNIRLGYQVDQEANKITFLEHFLDGMFTSVPIVIYLFPRDLRIFIISWGVCPWQAFPGFLMFAGKSGAFP
jgi:hypothetical protein